MNRGEIVKTVVSYVTDAAERINHYMLYKGMLDFIRKKCPHLSKFSSTVDQVDFKILSKPCTLFVVMDEQFAVPAGVDPEDYLLGCIVPGVVVLDMIEPEKVWGMETKLKTEMLLTTKGQDVFVNHTAKIIQIFENFRDGTLIVVDKMF